MLFPLWNLIAETRIGSDHIPLVLSSGEDRLRHSPRFFFETAWFEVDRFNQMFLDEWDAALAGFGSQRAPPPRDKSVALCGFVGCCENGEPTGGTTESCSGLTWSQNCLPWMSRLIRDNFYPLYALRRSTGIVGMG